MTTVFLLCLVVYFGCKMSASILKWLITFTVSLLVGFFFVTILGTLLFTVWVSVSASPTP